MNVRAYLVCLAGLLCVPFLGASADELVQSACTCYYGYDQECGLNEACDKNWNPINCERRSPDGGSQTGACTNDTGQNLIAPCDANCGPKTKRYCQSENPDTIAQSLELWRQAMTQPGLAGGGTVNRILASHARDVTVSPECSEYLGWRVLGIMEMCRGDGYVTHPAQYDELEDHILGSLVGNTCKTDSGNKCVAALTQGLYFGEPAVDPIVDQIVASCPGGLPFGTTGLAMPPLDGVKTRLKVTVYGLSPAAVPGSSSLGMVVLVVLFATTGSLAILRFRPIASRS